MTSDSAAAIDMRGTDKITSSRSELTASRQRITKMATAGAIGRITRPLIDQLQKLAKTNVPTNHSNKRSEAASRWRSRSAQAKTKMPSPIAAKIPPSIQTAEALDPSP